MDTQLLLEVGTAAWTLMLIVALLSTVISVVVGVTALSRRRIHPVVSALPVAPVALYVAVSLWWGTDLIAVFPVALAAGIFAALPAAALLFLVAIAGCYRGPRAWRMMGAVWLGGALVIGATLLSGVWMEGMWPFALFRSGGYAVALVALGLASLGGGRDGSLRWDPGLCGATAWVLWVGSCEVAVQGSLAYFLTMTLTNMPDPSASRGLELIRLLRESHVDPSWWWGWGILLLAVGVASIPLAAAVRVRGARSLWVLVFWAIAPLSLGTARIPSSLWEAWVAQNMSADVSTDEPEAEKPGLPP
jgi:hypothetical protein